MKITDILFVASCIAISVGYATDSSANDNHLPAGIAWRQRDVSAAFAEARSSNKPLFLYWGAEWCPPCNQVKATIFNQAAFIQRTRQFIPVYLDGDSRNAQKLAARFKVRGYPTMVLFLPDGSELTRLPGEADAARYLQVLTLALAAARPFKATLETALRDGSSLSTDEWRLLADYAWDTDDAQLVARDELAKTLLALAKSVPGEPIEIATRLKLKALVAAAAEKSTALDTTAGLETLNSVLADPGLARSNFDILVNYAGELTKSLTEDVSPQRIALIDKWHSVLQQLADDPTLSTTDRLSAVASRVSLARLGRGKDALPEEILAIAREHVARADKSTANLYERHAVISAAADILASAGLLDESDGLLMSEMKRSRSPYYFMLQLAGNAKQRDDMPRALDWYEQAYTAAVGSATRLQWGVTYVNAIVDLAPQDETRLARAAQRLLKETGTMQDAFYERNRRSLEKLVGKLAVWNKEQAHDAAARKIYAQFHGICDKLRRQDPQRSSCEALLESAGHS